MVYGVAVLDDDRRILPLLKNMIERAFLKYRRYVRVECFCDARQFAREWNKRDFNAVFLDIDMPTMDGVEIARRRRRECRDDCIVFLSGHAERVFQTFCVEPLRFVRKGGSTRELDEAVGAILEQTERQDEAALDCMDGENMCRMPLKKVYYIECQNKRQMVVAANGVWLLRSSMEGLEARLCQHGFVRIHASYLVNCMHVFSIQGQKVILDDGSTLPVSRKRIEQTKESFMKAALL